MIGIKNTGFHAGFKNTNLPLTNAPKKVFTKKTLLYHDLRQKWWLFLE
jgi:hypothetical protein